MLYLVQTGPDKQLLKPFLEKGVIRVGWKEVGDLTGKTRNQVREIARQVYPVFSPNQVGSRVGSLDRLLHMKEGEHVTIFDPETREYRVGKVTGPYRYVVDPDFPDYPHARKVVWEAVGVVRDTLSEPTRFALVTLLAVSVVGEDAEAELLSSLGAKPLEVKVEDAVLPQEAGSFLEDYIEASRTAIGDRILKLDPYQMQHLVAGILRAMGYRTIVSEPGRDGGKDIVASRDGLGFENPRIVAQVKHKLQKKSGTEDINALAGILTGDGDRGLFVSTGGFSGFVGLKSHDRKITLIDLDSLVNLVDEYYDEFDAETRTLLPLKKAYWPIG